MEKAGKIFKAARKRKQVSLAEAAAVTKIKADHLRALEEGDVGALPSPAYARGFIKIYSHYLGVDPDPALKEYQEYFRASQPELVLIENKKLAAVPLLPPVNWGKTLRFLALAALAAGVVLVSLRLIRSASRRYRAEEFGLYEEASPPGSAVRLDPSEVFLPSQPEGDAER